MSDIKSKKAIGGKALASKRTPEERKESSRKAVEAKRERASLPAVINEGPLIVGDVILDVAVLEDGDRVVSVGSVFEALGRPPRGNKKSLMEQRVVDGVPTPPFMDAINLKPFITTELVNVIKKIKYKTQTGVIKEGYNVLILPLVGDLYLRARESGVVRTADQQEAARKAEILVRSLAKVGIIALVDEATGYQRDRKRDALASLLEKYIAKEMRPWLRTFQLDFFEELSRVWGYKMPEKPGAYPPVFAHVIRDIVYDRLAPGVRQQLQELKKKNGGKMHQWLTEHAGYGDLTRHLGEVTMLLRLTDDSDKDGFMKKLNKIKPVLTVNELVEAAESKEKSKAI